MVWLFGKIILTWQKFGEKVRRTWLGTWVHPRLRVNGLAKGLMASSMAKINDLYLEKERVETVCQWCIRFQSCMKNSAEKCKIFQVFLLNTFPFKSAISALKHCSLIHSSSKFNAEQEFVPISTARPSLGSWHGFLGCQDGRPINKMATFSFLAVKF